MSAKEYDVIVIGAGNGGLSAACVAAKNKLKTLLVEQHNLPGGFATSFTRGRFEFEPSLHEVCDLGYGDNLGGLGEFFKNLGLDVEWLPVPEAYRMILTDKGQELDVEMPFGVEDYIAKMEEYAPGSGPKTREFMALCQEVLDAIKYIADCKGNTDKKVMKSKYANFLKTASYSLEEVQDAIKIPESVKKILNAYWCYLGISTDRLNFTVYAAMFLKYLMHGACVPKNRSHEISTAFDKVIRDNNGDIMYNTKIEKILVNNGEVQGVVTDKGQIIKTKHIISNASPHLVYSSMIEPSDQIPALAKQSSNARRVGPAGFVVYLGLNKSPEKLGLRNYSYFIYPSMDTQKLYQSLGQLNGDTVQATVCLNLANPNCSPKGTSIVSMTTLFTQEAWNKVNVENYHKTKNKIALKMVEDFEKATGVELKDYIEEFEVATPMTFANYTGAYNGAIYGYEPDSWDSIMPRMMMMEDDVLIKGLRFCGGFAFRVHGYSSSYLSGETTALLTLKEIKEENNG